jgi:archaellum biogenesis protein FlaJ (TadC family)
MTKMTKTLLVLAIVCLVVGLMLNSGLINVGGNDVLYLVLPLGATFFGLFLIAKVLSKESERYDEEHEAAQKKDPQGHAH